MHCSFLITTSLLRSTLCRYKKEIDSTLVKVECDESGLDSLRIKQTRSFLPCNRNAHHKTGNYTLVCQRKKRPIIDVGSPF